MHKFRTHQCGELTFSSVGKLVKVSGWIHRKRDHGGIYFIDLRDYSGIVQLVTSDQEFITYKLTKESFRKLRALNCESVITVQGKVIKRSYKTANNDILTGQIEVMIIQYHIESKSSYLPINIHSIGDVSEDLRLKYRFLDLRRTTMQQNIKFRSEVIRFLRTEMYTRNFLELQTPILSSSSPEGARDFLVPSRLNPGNFYALPQSPQQFKQLYMIAGFDKYFQIAPCFRDEDARADRAPGEFYQLDVEMSFVTQEDIFVVMEAILFNTFTKFGNLNVSDIPFPKISYKDSLMKYGTDKPDLRNPIIIKDVTSVFKGSQFSIFHNAINKGSIVKAIPINKAPNLTRGFFNKMNIFAQSQLKSEGLAYITINANNETKGPVAKFLGIEKLNDLKKICNLQSGDSVLFICDQERKAIFNAGKIRSKVGEDLNLIDQGKFRFCWIIDYPLYCMNHDTHALEFFHNPFSMPQGGLEVLEKAKSLESKLSIKAYQYDIICNGLELSSGAIRNHQLPIMYKSFNNVGFTNDQVNTSFPAIINALKYGAPPHGGIAPGIDRMIMLLAEKPNIREIIAFPLNQRGKNFLMDAPSAINSKLLTELRLSILK